jgi:hypothetical protein
MRAISIVLLGLLLTAPASAKIERSLSIEGDIKHRGEINSVWSAFNVKLATNGYNKCSMNYAGFEFNCNIRTVNPDSMTDSETVITMDEMNFLALVWMAAQNTDLPQDLRDQFFNNIQNYSRNYDTMTNKPAVEFLLNRDEVQETKFLSSRADTVSIIRVIQH